VEAHTAGLAFKFLTKEPLIAILPTRHRLARHRAVRPQDLARESFISTARVAPVLRTVIDDYAAKEGITLKQKYDAETLSGGMSLVASTTCYSPSSGRWSEPRRARDERRPTGSAHFAHRVEAG
jgi:LysR family hca operon transcriptional activator